MKKILITLFVLLSTIAHAEQPEIKINTKAVVINTTREIVAYNAAIVGYAQACAFPSNEYQLIEDGLFKFIDSNNKFFSKTEISNMKSFYKNTREQVYAKKRTLTKVECELFKEEFIKIYNTINESIKKSQK